MCGTPQRSIRISTRCRSPLNAIVSDARGCAASVGACAAAEPAVGDSITNAMSQSARRLPFVGPDISSPTIEFAICIGSLQVASAQLFLQVITGSHGECHD